MDEATQARYRAMLEALLAELESDDQLGEEAQRTVTLDQQSVGRLSRMDALQGQAMAKATAARRAAQRRRIQAAFERMDEDEYGYCAECGEEIAEARLDLDPAVPTCISCARG
ncbi:TraR/DksA C4-type zinc finger protein [Maritimibacter sp. UBA3975]|uniref:TraR/DksA family transcriptional regulator n=1 Tax=Maritimibacter sp. UBA3975 TaxID=1946833 RepID=UPI0025C401A5|nr:TraR/DksA C4-type zinc finger protein [Maritimibacter sp. UBA3975]|tara:strand:+ start:16102 stop:16440 length:339 start_codon:yes stop_codon:yes gene_type:complete